MLRLEGISLEYGIVQALRHVDLAISAGEVLAIVGEHGAGKTSLARVISGLSPASAGGMAWNGRRLEAFSPEEAHRLGIELVPQHCGLSGRLTVAENLLINNRNIIKRRFFSSREINAETRRYLRSVSYDIDPGTRVCDLPLPDRTLVEILRHLSFEPRLLILDESLAKLTQAGLDIVQPLLLEMTGKGMAILFITHSIDEVFSIADRVAIIRQGDVFFEDSVKNIDKISLIKLAYTQIMRKDNLVNYSQEFHDLLVYNEAIIDYLPINLILIDGSGTIKIINESARDFFGLPEEASTGISIDSFLLSRIARDNGGNFIDSVKSELFGPARRTFYDLRIAVRDEERTVNLTTCPIFDGEHRVGYTMIVEDFTEQAKLKERVALTERLSSIGILAAGVAHEINNPLSVVSNYLELIQLQNEDPALKGIVSKMEEEVASIERIVGNLITLNEKNPSDLQNVGLNELLGGIVDLVVFHAAFQEIRLDFSPAAEELFILANRIEIKQIALNIIRNSLEAMNEGGSISIATRAEVEGPLRMALMVFEDDGPGIPTHNLKDVFVPFYSNKSGTVGNMGLGLSISYGIAQKYGGTIEVENLSPRGCRFSLRFPAL
jgi:PAS domain S-box-containing protein